MRALTALLLACLLMTQAGCAWLVTKLAKATAMPAQTTSTLSDVVLTTMIGSNLPPSELGTISQSFFNGWRTGGDLVVFMFTKGSDTGFYKIDGTVTVDGKPAEYLTIGNYSVLSDASPAPRRVEIATTTGERASFVIEPSKRRFKVLSLNGQRDRANLDLTRDVVVELDGAGLPADALLKVSLAINQVGIKSMYEVCHVRYQPRITIPAAAFRNINIKPGANALFNYRGSYLYIEAESTQDAKEVAGKLPAVQYTSSYGSGMFVTVGAEPRLNPGLTVKGELADMSYEAFKPGAFLSRPSEQLTRMGLISLSIRGTTFHESSEVKTTSNTLVMGGIANTTTTTTVKTTTLQFPRQHDETWDALLEDLYPDLLAALREELGAEEVPVDKITATDAYKLTEALAKDDKNTKVEFARSFRKTKVLSAFMPVTEGYGVNGVNERIMKESGADALVTLTLDLAITQGQGEKVLMVPKFAFEIVGKANGSRTNTKFFSGTIQSTKGVPFTAKIDGDELRSIVRKASLLRVLRAAIKELRAKERQNGDYLPVWDLQKEAPLAQQVPSQEPAPAGATTGP